MKHYTSLELSKKLKENGCKLEYYKKWVGNELKDLGVDGYRNNWTDDTPAYDILYEICVKYPHIFFGEGFVCRHCGTQGEFKKCESVDDLDYSYQYFSKCILMMLQQGEEQKEIEDYIWKNCKFNKKQGVNCTKNKQIN